MPVRAIALRLAPVVIALLVTGCISVTRISEDDMPDTATTVDAVTFGRADQCTRSIEVRTPIANSTEIDETESLTEVGHPAPDSLLGITEQSDATGYAVTDDRPALLAAYVAQATPETCYAAVLAMIWRAAGMPRDEASFIDAVRAACGDKAPGAANYLQILSAVSFVHEGKRFDPYSVESVPFGAVTGRILSRDGSETKFFQGTRLRCPLPPFICIVAGGTGKLKRSSSTRGVEGDGGRRRYSDGRALSPSTLTVEEDEQNLNGGLRWKSHRYPQLDGGVFPLRSAADLAYALRNGAYVVAGLHREGHVLIVDGLHVNEQGSFVDRLRVIDPADPDRRHYWIAIARGPKLEGLSFALSVWNI